MNGTTFSDTGKFPKIFIGLIEGNKFLCSRIDLITSPGRIKLNPPGINKQKREILKNSIIETMYDPVSEKNKKIQFDSIQSDKTVFVIYRCKPSIFGGPLLNFISIVDLLSTAKIIAKNNIDHKVFPLLVIEDDKPDNHETTRTHILDNSYKTIELTGYDISKEDRTICSKISFSNHIYDCLDEFEFVAGYNKYGRETADILRSYYIEGSSLTNSFIRFIDKITGSGNLLFLSCNIFRKNGGFKDFVEFEISTPGLMKQYSKEAAKLMKENGFEIKPKVRDINLEQIFKNKSVEYDCNDFNKNEILNLTPVLLSGYPALYSSIPVAAEISTPSSIGHLTLLKEYFAEIKINLPAILPRHSITFTDNIRFSEFSSKHKDNLLFNFIFPDGHLQERLISPAYLASINSFEKLRRIAEELVKEKADKHYTADLNMTF